MRTPYFSRNKLYKSPFGAVDNGTAVTFRLILPFDCSSAVVAIQRDGELQKYYQLSKEETAEQDGVWWSCTLGPFSTGLYFYYFEFDTPFGHNVLYKGKTDGAVMNSPGTPYQLTVFDSGYTPPSWLCGGLIYQIFPDRFCKKGDCKNPFPERYIYKEFTGQPAFEQLEKEGGRQLNNDYFCGNIQGIISKLDYLKSLGVSCIYLNPIFEAHSNHRYNTADYMKIDPLLGSEEDFKELCEKAQEQGIDILLDGVFSHTGEDSIYFNKKGRYRSLGAYQSEQSPYFGWYTFNSFPDDYKSWWGIKSLPEIREENEQYLEFITGKGGVVEKWLNLGAAGFRLDVADELPDIFLDRLNRSVKEAKKDALIIGEVWEDASTKESYGKRRRYLCGGQLDSVMNYPFYEAILAFLSGGDGDKLLESVWSIIENYPKHCVDLLMNHMGTHDTVRLITRLAGEPPKKGDRLWQSRQKLSDDRFKKGVTLQKLAAFLQYTLPGVPSLYYGDELGSEGYSDPFNRAPFEPEKGNRELITFYKFLGSMRKNEAFAGGEFIPVRCELGTFSFIRKKGRSAVLAAVNRWCEEESLPLPDGFENSEITGGRISNGQLFIPAYGFALLEKSTEDADGTALTADL